MVDRNTSDMGYKRKPLYIAMVIFAIVMTVESIISGIYSLTIVNESWSETLSIISIFTFVFALYYIFVGSRKESSAFFKSFLVMFCLIMIVTVLCIINNVSITGDYNDAIATSVINFITYGFLFILLIVPDLGRTKSFTYSIFIMILQFLQALSYVFFNPGIFKGGSIANTVENIVMKSNFVLSLVLFVLIYAKYEDKARRKMASELDTKCEIKESDGAIIYEERSF